MPRGDVREKTKKNLIVHNYIYHLLDKSIERQIEELDKKRAELRRLQGGKIDIYIPQDSDVMKIITNGNPLICEGKLMEWNSNKIYPDGTWGQVRELVYIEKVNHDADVDTLFNEKARYVTEVTDEKYTHLECTHYSNKNVIRLTGYDLKDIS